jgi:two-component system KDP operon response regulator KdpE
MNDPARPPRVASSDQFRFGQFRLDISKRRLTCGQAEVCITRSEYLLLRTLAMHRGETVSRRQLMQAIWGSATATNGALESLVAALRHKLPGLPSGLLSDSGVQGYALHTEHPAPRAKRSAPAS